MIIHRGISENSHWSLSKKKSVFSEGNGDAYILVPGIYRMLRKIDGKNGVQEHASFIDSGGTLPIATSSF